MTEWYDYIKYIGTVMLIVPILFLFRYPITLILYIVGIFVNILVNYTVKYHEKELPPLYEKRKFVKKIKEKYNFYEYNLYGYPSEKNQNIGYSIGFIGSYLAQNRQTMKNRDIYILSFMIFLFYITVIVTIYIIYMARRNSAPQIIAGHSIGIVIGIIFFKLSDPVIAFKTI